MEQDVVKTRKAAFLGALHQTRNVSSAASLASISRAQVYRDRHNDPEFAADWDTATAIRPVDIADLEASAMERALNGWLEPVFHKGEIVGQIRKYNTTLTIFMLKAHGGERYRFEHLVPEGGADELAVGIRSALAEMGRMTTILPPTNGHAGNGQINGAAG